MRSLSGSTPFLIKAILIIDRFGISISTVGEPRHPKEARIDLQEYSD
jgi:hypothetical protein